MPADNWEQLQEIFHAAMALPEAERQAFVEERCGDDAALSGEVMALIEAEAAPASVIDLPFAEDSGAVDLALEGTELGAYRLIRRIGSGGMGSVFLAERADGTFERQVALKVVKKGMDSEGVVRRFRVERQILARLDHPNIAGLLDGGVTEDGRPYFVMEYVDGVPITTYCDANRLGVSERLNLFSVVCDAVQYAHQSLVVHRDLKPSNILVTEDGEVRLLDFGIAKLLDQAPDDDLTRPGMLPLTPAYAAPEQLLGESVTTVTDIYSLGVILYELLTGRRPFEVRRGAAEYREQVIDGSPLRPSTAVTRVPAAGDGQPDVATQQRVAEVRGVQMARLQAALRGDLDTICLMALRRAPGSRYVSASQLAGDVQRHLRGMPVVARPDSVSYRFGKFVRRHRVGVASVAAATLVFLATIAFYTNEIARERDVALEEQQKTQEVVNFVVGLFKNADPAQSRGAEITARELLDAGRARIRGELGDRPAVQATLQRVLGEVYYELDLTDEAERLLESALMQQRTLYGPVHLESGTTLLSLGINQQTQGDYAAAGESIREALAVRRVLLPPVHYDVLEALAAAAFLEETIGEYAAAEKLHLEALQMAQELAMGRDDGYLGQVMMQLASLYRIQDRLEEAEPLLRDALAMQDRFYGGPHPDSDETKRQLAELLAGLRQFEEAQALFLELIESRTQMMGADHYEVGSAWNSYGHLLRDKGDSAGAKQAYTNMIDIVIRSYGGEHPSLAAGYNNIGFLERNAGNFDSALENFQRSLDMQEAVGLDPQHPNRSFPTGGIGSTYLLMARYAEAAETLQAAMDLRRAAFDEEHSLISELKSDLAAAQIQLGQYAEAERQLLEIYPLLERDWGLADPRTTRAAARLVALFDLTGRAVLADPYREVAVDPSDDVMLRYGGALGVSGNSPGEN